MEKVILGLDPGTVRTGFAVMNKKNKISLLDFGVLSAPAKKPLTQRLLVIGKKLEDIYKQYSVSDTAIEQVFFGKNPDSAFKLGQAFGICVYQAMCFKSLVCPYAARYIKQSITGFGSADKQSVKNFVLNILGIKQDEILSDATDAMAVALCHIYQVEKPSLALPESGSSLKSGFSRNGSSLRRKTL